MTETRLAGHDADGDDADGDGRPLTFPVVVGSLVTVGLMFVALYAWRHASVIAGDWEASRPYVAAWAVRSAAIAVAAAAQVILLTVVVGRLYPRQLVDEVLRLTAVLIGTVALVSALALAFAGR